MAVGAVALLAVSLPMAGATLRIPTHASGVPSGAGGTVLGAFFTANSGQVVNRDVRFYASLGSLRVGFADGSVVLDLSVPPSGNPQGAARGDSVRLSFEGSRAVGPTAADELPHRSHFFLGSDPGGWRTDVRNYRQIRYSGLYPGIDLVYRIDGGLKYDLIVRPGADPSAVAMEFQGAESVALEGGDLVVTTAAGGWRDTEPVALQEDVRIPCAFVLRGALSVGFRCDPWDRTRPLVIDPLIYSTFLGGSNGEDGYAIAVDTTGSAYVAGRTASPNFPTTAGAYDTTFAGLVDVFVAKLDPNGALVYSTFLGGTDYESGVGIAVDASGNAYVLGQTFSFNFPTTAGAFDTTYNGGGDAYVAKLNASGGVLVYSTFLGGVGRDADVGSSIAVDRTGAVYVTGLTQSSDFPTTASSYDTTYNGAGDAFVAKLNASGGGLEYSTYLGGAGSDVQNGSAIAVDGSGNAYVTGDTSSDPFPTTAGAFDTTYNGARDVFVAKLDPAGSAILWSTYLGGSAEDADPYRRAIAVGPDDAVYVSGLTRSADFPTTAGAYDRTANGGADVFAVRLNASGASMDWGTLVGGTGDDSGHGIGLDAGIGPVLFGSTTSSDFPTTAGAYDPWLNGTLDAFVVRLGPLGDRLVYGTFFGGSGSDDAIAGAVDPSGYVYLTGQTASGDFPTTPGAADPSFNGDRDAFVTRLDLLVYAITVDTDPPGLQVEVDAVAYAAPTTFLCAVGETHDVSAPSPQIAGRTRYTFVSWSDGGAESHSIPCSASATLTASFRAEHEVIVDTDPTGLQVFVDGATYTAPRTFWCVDGIGFTVDVASPQGDSSPQGGTRYSFVSWSDGGAQSHSNPCNEPFDLLATFEEEYGIVVDTSPPSLEVRVDGTDIAAPYAFWCPEGTTPGLGVPSPQVAGPTRFVFDRWSDGGAESHSIACDAPRNYTAFLRTEHLIALATVPAGLRLVVGGAEVTAPYAVWCPATSATTALAPSPQVDGRTQHRFTSWSDGAPQSRTIPCTAPASYTATFATEFEIVIRTEPAGYRVAVSGTVVATRHAFWCLAGSGRSLEVPSPQGDGVVRAVSDRWSDGAPSSRKIACDAPAEYVAELRPDWKPVVALAFAVVLATAGTYVAMRARRAADRRREAMRTWARVALPFITLELVTAVVAWLTGWLVVPPALGLGTLVDGAVLASGLAVQGWVVRRRSRELSALPPPPRV